MNKAPIVGAFFCDTTFKNKNHIKIYTQDKRFFKFQNWI
jgi:predicted patatin/cPLA2 family phospholipase